MSNYYSSSPPAADQPFIDTNVFPTISEGQQITVSSQDLHVTDGNPNIPSDYAGTPLEIAIKYTTAQEPSHGVLEWNTAYPSLWSGGPSWFLQPVTEFTQNDLDNGWIWYKSAPTFSGDDSFSFTVSDGFGGTIELTTATIPIQGNVSCFAAGTRIRTEHAEMPVEVLTVGDRVRTNGNDIVPIIWLGHRRVDCRRHPRPRDVWPVRISANAFGTGQPHRDLWLSPDHAVFNDGVLIPVCYLINGATIVQTPVDDVTYWHVELDHHNVILAEGLTCESYLDTGNRGAFANGGPAVHMHPDFALRVWDGAACAPLVLDGPRLVAATRRLLARAMGLGHALTVIPDLKVLTDGGQLPVEVSGQQWHVRLPQAAKHIRLVSRIWIPAHTRPDEGDARSLGVAISRLWLDDRAVSLESPGLTAGWHTPEPNWRWTDGDAELALSGVRELAFSLAMTGTYWRDQKQRAAQAA